MACHLDQPEDPELLLYSLDFNKSLVEQALAITAQYVSEHKLILTGGTAIDIALRSKGTSIYSEDALPDYDIVSSDNLKHATALAEILCNEGFQDINVIGAIHITTVRVRIKNITLLDATYLPENLMHRIPYLDIGEFRIISPDYQKIDQRLSLATLMADTGVSLNIFNRMKKDIMRNEILRDRFDLPPEEISIKVETVRVKLPLQYLRHNTQEMRVIDPNCFIYTGDVCVSGFMAYALYYHEYCKAHKPLEGTIDPHIQLTSTHIEFDLPKGAEISFLNCSNQVEETLEKISGVKRNKFKKYNWLANLQPITFKAFKQSYVMEVSDSYGSRFGAVLLEDMVVSSTDYLLMQFLRDRIYADTEQLRAVNTLYYQSLMAMMLDRHNHADESKIWYPTINCYGFDIPPEYKVFAIQKLMDSEHTKDMKPRNSYLRVPQCKTKAEFDPTLSHYFQLDGLENDKITHTNLKWVMDQLQEYSQEVSQN